MFLSHSRTALFYFYFSSHLNIDVGVIEKERRRTSEIDMGDFVDFKKCQSAITSLSIYEILYHKDSLIIRELV